MLFGAVYQELRSFCNETLCLVKIFSVGRVGGVLNKAVKWACVYNSAEHAIETKSEMRRQRLLSAVLIV